MRNHHGMDHRKAKNGSSPHPPSSASGERMNGHGKHPIIYLKSSSSLSFNYDNEASANAEDLEMQSLLFSSSPSSATRSTMNGADGAKGGLGAIPGRPRMRAHHPSASFKNPVLHSTTAAPAAMVMKKKRGKKGRRNKNSHGSGFIAFLSRLVRFGKWGTKSFASSSSSPTATATTTTTKAGSRKAITAASSLISNNITAATLKISIAVILWYLLGVISIGTSKILLSDPSHNVGPMHHVGHVRPLLLTVQQLVLGCGLLRLLLTLRAFESMGVQHLPRRGGGGKSLGAPDKELFLSALFFGLGFLSTNYSFHSSAASFVETVKASEPITSAAVAVFWRIETLSFPEVASLTAIVTGVLFSTVGHSNGGHGDSMGADILSTAPSLANSVQSCLVVMISNLCFSFRGLHQKLFRASPQGSAAVMDDMNLQYRMQQIGVVLFIIPALIFNLPEAIGKIWRIQNRVGLIQSGIMVRYVGISLLNGFAFASYNLASTYILTRISVVHHAALNCIRRIFAIVVTSIYFGVPITLLGAFGILISFCGFMSFTHYKIKRQQQPRPLSSLLPMSAV